jgi:hypothetical protein
MDCKKILNLKKYKPVLFKKNLIPHQLEEFFLMRVSLTNRNRNNEEIFESTLRRGCTSNPPSKQPRERAINIVQKRKKQETD